MCRLLMAPAWNRDGATMEPGRHCTGDVTLPCVEPEASKPALLTNNAYPAIERHAAIRDHVRRSAYRAASPIDADGRVLSRGIT
jgi:hypothetical protein